MRKLAVSAVSFSAAIFVSNIIGNSISPAILAAAAAICGLVLCLAAGESALRLKISLISIAFGFAWFAVFYGFTVERAVLLDGSNIRVQAVLKTLPLNYGDYSRAEGKVISGPGKGLGFIISDSSGSLKLLEPGDIFVCDAKIKRADIRYGEEYDDYNARGIFMVLSVKNRFLKSGEMPDIYYMPVRIKYEIDGLIDRIFPADTSSFMKSLLLGDKRDFYKNQSLRISMRRAGIMHVVAVSGMHVSFFVSFILLLLGKGRRQSFLCLIIVWVFIAVTGMPHSAVRAGFMITMLLIAPIFRRENDAITSLTFALMVILIFNPFSAMSTGLQLSFGAMAGIMLFSEKIYRVLTSKIKNKAWEYIAGILSSSFGVLVLSMPLTAIRFGSVQILSPITNTFILWALSICFCGGFVACLFSLIYGPAGVIIASVISFFA